MKRCAACQKDKADSAFYTGQDTCRSCTMRARKAAVPTLDDALLEHRAEKELAKMTRQEKRNVARARARVSIAAKKKRAEDRRQVTAQDKALAQRILCRRKLLEFTKFFHPRYVPGWVHHDICRRLEKFSDDVAAGLSPRLMLLVPPRHGKSELASINFPAWHLGRHPHHEMINASYNVNLPMGFSRKIRNILRDSAYHSIFPETKLDPDSQAAEAWNTTAGGAFVAAGVGGGITGKGAHVLTIDDPIKNIAEADSIDVREALMDWYMSTAYTRLAPGGGVLVIETWWNDDDLAGRLQKLMAHDPLADQFVVIKYPAVAEFDEYLDVAADLVRHADPVTGDFEEGGRVSDFDAAALRLLRRKGEALHEARYPRPALDRIKRTLSGRLWSALYQQNPSPDEGAYIKKEYFKYTGTPPDRAGRNCYQAWDFAIGEKQSNDWTVGTTSVQDEFDNMYPADQVRFRGDSYTIVTSMLDAFEKWQPDVVGVEDGQIWRSIEPIFKKECERRRLYPNVELLRPLTDKMARGRTLQGRMQAGKVYWPKNAAWLPYTEQEMLRFPAGAHDDAFDSWAWNAQLCTTHSPPAPLIKEQKTASWKDGLKQYIGGTRTGSHMAA